MTRFQTTSICVSLCLTLFLCGSALAAPIGDSVSAGLANNPDLLYNPANGNVKLYADGSSIGSFNLQSLGMFNPPADYSALTADTGYPSGPTDNSSSAMGWISGGVLFGIGFDGPAGSTNTAYADLGNIFPTGMDQAGLDSFLTNNAWAEPIGGGPGGSFDLLTVPEPSSLLLAGLGLLGLAYAAMRRRASKLCG